MVSSCQARNSSAGAKIGLSAVSSKASSALAPACSPDAVELQRLVGQEVEQRGPVGVRHGALSSRSSYSATGVFFSSASAARALVNCLSISAKIRGRSQVGEVLARRLRRWRCAA